jgi:hypothetical protein
LIVRKREDASASKRQGSLLTRFLPSHNLRMPQITYEAYGSYLLEHQWQGLWPLWSELTVLVQAAWKHAALCTREAFYG